MAERALVHFNYPAAVWKIHLHLKKGRDCPACGTKSDYPYKTQEYFEQTDVQQALVGRASSLVTKWNWQSLSLPIRRHPAGRAQLQAMVDAGWIITGLANRHWKSDQRACELIFRCRSRPPSISFVVPRENPDGSLRTDEVGDWRDVLAELPKRIHEWMPRLAEEGVVGADAIFACLGPALEVFSRYSRVEKASGETVTLKEYLVHVWAAVARRH